MNRRNFLKWLGITTTGILITPTVVAEALAKKDGDWYFDAEMRERIQDRIDYLHQYPMTVEESFRANITIHYEDDKWIYYYRKGDPKHRISWLAKSEFPVYEEAQKEFDKLEYKFLFGESKV